VTILTLVIALFDSSRKELLKLGTRDPFSEGTRFRSGTIGSQITVFDPIAIVRLLASMSLFAGGPRSVRSTG